MLLLALTLILGDFQWSEVSPFAGSSYPEYLELSRGPPSVGSISVSRSTSSCPKCLQLSRAPPGEHLQLSKVPLVVESDFCQTGSAISNIKKSLSRQVRLCPEKADVGHPPIPVSSCKTGARMKSHQATSGKRVMAEVNGEHRIFTNP